MCVSHLPPQVEALRRSDVTDQLAEARERISGLQEDKGRSAALLAEVRARSDKLERELREGEARWREGVEQVSWPLAQGGL